MPFLLLLALISYTPEDESNINIKFSDLFKLFSKDAIISAKASTTQNWLGLIGAYLSNFLYNGTFGYIIILLPVLIIAWSERLFTGGEIYKKLIQYTIMYFVIAIAFASLIGSLQHFQLLESIPKEWSGNIGKYLSSVTVGFIGTIGATSFFGLVILVSLYYGTDINFNRYFTEFFKLLVRTGNILWVYIKKLLNIISEKSYESVEKAKDTIKEQFAEELKPESKVDLVTDKTDNSQTDNNYVENSGEDSLMILRNKSKIHIKVNDKVPQSITAESPNPFNKLGLGDKETQIKPIFTDITKSKQETDYKSNSKEEQQSDVPAFIINDDIEETDSTTHIPAKEEKVYTSIDDDLERNEELCDHCVLDDSESVSQIEDVIDSNIPTPVI